MKMMHNEQNVWAQRLTPHPDIYIYERVAASLYTATIHENSPPVSDSP